LEGDRAYQVTPLIEQKKLITNLITSTAEYNAARALYGLPPIETPASTYEFTE
jgi:hypothetical protein